MVALIIQTSGDVADILSIENVTVFGVLIAVIGWLIWERLTERKRFKEEIDFYRSEIEKAKEAVDKEYRETNKEMKMMAENYHTFTTKVFNNTNQVLEKLRDMMNRNPH